MAYANKRGRRPMEMASKSAHVHLATSPSVIDIIGRCNYPNPMHQIEFDQNALGMLKRPTRSPIQQVITIDGGYTTVSIQAEYPTSKVCFFQFGTLELQLNELRAMTHRPFLAPEDFSKLKQIERHGLLLPIQNTTLKSESSLAHSIRKAIYEFFLTNLKNGLTTLSWLIFEEFGVGIQPWVLSSCPSCGEPKVVLHRKKMKPDFTFDCCNCAGCIYLTDVLQICYQVNDRSGSMGVLGNVATAIEQLILADKLRDLLQKNPKLLEECLFLKDGPLAFFGPTANLHKPMRKLMLYMIKKHKIYLAGVEKSGPFVEHASEIAMKLNPGEYLILGNDYIYQNILPNTLTATKPYGHITYYGNKLIFKSAQHKTFVLSIPATQSMLRPTKDCMPNLNIILSQVEALACQMFDDALLPIALTNQLISISNRPSSRILRRLAKTSALPNP